jgi:hypothetical protein
MGNEHVNAPNMDTTQRGKVTEQHQNATIPVVQRDPIALSTTHQATPHTSTHPRVVNVQYDDNHEHV